MASEQKLNDDEKVRLITFYKENQELWVVKGITRSEKIQKKEELVDEFEGKFTIETLEKVFHILKTNFQREYNKYEKDGKIPNKPWKFYEHMLFLKEEPRKIARTQFTTDERETLITFYHSNPLLWNHGLTKYRDRNIRRALIQKLVEDLDDKFTEDDIKKEWNSLMSRYRKERQAENTSKSSGAGIDDVYHSSWKYFDHMTFLETTPEYDPLMSTLESFDNLPIPPAKKSKSNQESDARAALYTALAKSFEKPTSPPTSTISEPKNDENSRLMERANLFGKTVADNLLQCDPKDWTLIKKKIFDLFFDYEQGNLRRNNAVNPFNNNGNYVPPAYPNFIPPVQSFAELHNNEQSRSGFQDYGAFNQPMQPLSRNKCCCFFNQKI